MKLKLKKKNLAVLVGIVAVLIVGIILVIVFTGKGKENKIDENDTFIPTKKQDKVSIVDTSSKSRPFAVMINNLGATRPYHMGLQESYLNYEIVVEGGITRYLALFKDSDVKDVGSVRSARHYYLDYVQENDAYYVHWGWSPLAQQNISKLKIDNINGLTEGSKYFYRKDFDVAIEHRGFANLAEIKNLVDKKGYRSTTNKDLLLTYSASDINVDAIENKQVANRLDFKYSNSNTTNYVYDNEAKVYKQFVNDKEHTDYNTKKQYTAKNIIVYQVKNVDLPDTENKGRQDLDNLGKGDGYFITNGYAMPITWEKKDHASQTVYRYKDGSEIKVNDGNTWIHIVPTSGNVSISE